MTLYQRLGGQDAVSLVVDQFYEFMLADIKVAHFFATVDMQKQKKSQKEFIALVTGGPNNYQGQDMAKAHCKLKIGRFQFDSTWQNLQKALSFYNVPNKEAQQLKQIFYSVQDDIINQKTCPINKQQKSYPINQSQKPIQNESEISLYNKLGGQSALKLVVNKFYQLMLKDPKVSYYFKQTDMNKQIQSQVQFLQMVTGGPINYFGKDMKNAHSQYKIGDLEFNVTWDHLETAMKLFSVSQLLIKDVKDIFYSVQGDIVNQTQKQTTQIDHCIQKNAHNNLTQKQTTQIDLLCIQQKIQQKAPNKVVSPLNQTSGLKCPYMDSTHIKSVLQNPRQNQKCQIAHEILVKLNEHKQVQKLNNSPYKKTYY